MYAIPPMCVCACSLSTCVRIPTLRVRVLNCQTTASSPVCRRRAVNAPYSPSIVPLHASSCRPFYIAGESYAGIYIPTLADVIDKRGGINLQGIAVGPSP